MGGHGGLNILPQKSWNVYNRDNREQVERDEKKHKEEEDKKRKRTLQADHEYRVSLLKERAKKARSGDGEQADDQPPALPEAAPSSSSALAILAAPSSSSSAIMAGPSSPPRHINLFADIEAAVNQGGNAEYLAEKKAEEDKANRMVTSYLGQSSVEKAAEKPWYYTMPTTSTHTSSTPVKALDVKKRRQDDLRKMVEDPIRDISKFLDKKKTLVSAHKKEEIKQKAKATMEAVREREKRDRDKMGNLITYPHPASASAGRLVPVAGSASSKPSIEQLRQERLEREAREKAKVAALMARVTGDRCAAGARDGRYHSGFASYSGGFVRHHPRQ